MNAEQEQSVNTRVSRAKRVGIWLLGIVCVIVLLLSVLLGLLQNSSVQQWLAEYVSKSASSEDFSLDIQDLGGAIPWNLRVRSVDVGDAQGPWLHLEDVEVELAVSDLLLGNVRVPLVAARLLELQRLPEGKEAPKEAVKPEDVLKSLAPPELGVDAVRVDTIRVRKGILPQTRDFTLQAGYVGSGQGVVLKLNLGERSANTASGVAPGAASGKDGLKVDARLDLDQFILSIDMNFHEAPGGLVSTLAGLEGDKGVSAVLKGAGGLDAWTGVFTLGLGNMLACDNRIVLRLDELLAVETKGKVELGEALLSPELRGILGSELGVNLTLRLDPEKDDVFLDQLLVSTAATTQSTPSSLSVQGQTNLTAQSLDLGFTVKTQKLREISTGMGLQLHGAQEIKGTLKGTYQKPRVDVNAALGKLAYDTILVAGGTVRVNVEAMDNTSGKDSAAGWNVQTMLDLQDARLPGLEPLSTLAVRSSLAFANNILTINSLTVDSEKIGLNVAGSLGLDALDLDVKAKLEKFSLAALQGLQAAGIQGVGGLELACKGPLSRMDSGGELQLNITGGLKGLAGLGPELMEILGPELRLNVRADVQKGKLEIEDCSLKARSRLQLMGNVDLAKKQANVMLSGVVPKFTQLPEHVRVTGPITLKTEVAGPYLKPVVKATVSAAALDLSGQHVPEPAIHVTLTKTSALDAMPVSGILNVGVQGAGVKSTVATRFIYSQGKVELKQLAVAVPGASLSGDLALALQSALVNGQATLKVDDLAPVGVLMGQGLAGNGTLEAKLTTTRQKQGVDVKGSFGGIRYGDISLESLVLNATLPDVRDLSKGSANVEANSLRQGADLQVRTARVALAPNSSGARFDIDVQGQASEDAPFQLDAGGALAISDVTTVTLEKLEASYQNMPLSLRSPLSVVAGKGGYALQGINIDVLGGTLAGSGKMSEKDVSALLTLSDMDLAKLPLDAPLQGSLNGNVKLSGALQYPEVMVALELKELATGLSEGAASRAGKTLSISVNSELASGKLAARISLTGLGDKPLQANAALPCAFSLSPFIFDVKEKAAMEASVQGPLDLGALNVVLASGYQSMTGVAQLDLRVDGTLEELDIAGGIKLKNASYENELTGTLLDHMNATIMAEGEKLLVKHFSADDGEKGTLAVDGEVDFDSEKDAPFVLSCTFDKMSLTRMGLFTGATSGTLQIKGNAGGAKVKGALTIDPALTVIPQKMPPSVVDVPVKQVNAKGRVLEEPEEPKLPYDVELDVSVDIPARYFVRGQGVDSEWMGRISATGMLDELHVLGGLEAIRAHVVALGKKFELEKGALSFTGSTPPKPYIDMTAVAYSGSTKIIIQVVGVADDLDITFSSDPPLPQDEVFARLLFDEDMASISPVQAVVLAQAVAEMTTGEGSDFNVLNNIRDSLGLDELEVGRGDNGDPTFGVGVYVMKNVYVHGQTGTALEDNSVTVKVDVGKGVTAEGTANAKSEGGLGMSWEMDY